MGISPGQPGREGDNMNIKKAQKDVFKQILDGAKAGFFHVDKNNVLVSADGYMGYIFPTKKIRFSLDGLREITPFPIAELVKPENRMAPTENYRTTQHGMCRWMKHANGNYVLVQNKFLSEATDWAGRWMACGAFNRAISRKPLAREVVPERKRKEADNTPVDGQISLEELT